MLWANLNREDIYKGTIRQIESADFHEKGMFFGVGICSVKTQSKIYKENAILIKVAECGYVDLEKLNSILDIIKVNKNLRKNGSFVMGSIIMCDCTTLSGEGTLFVDPASIMPYTDVQEQRISIRKLRSKNSSQNI